jgi:hypothetical protein
MGNVEHGRTSKPLHAMKRKDKQLNVRMHMQKNKKAQIAKAACPILN